jgi:hypothetical protein
MDTEAFKRAYGAGRNGTNAFHFNPLFRHFQYSDGVKECVDAGCHWLLDKLATELPGVFRRNPDDTLLIVKVTVAHCTAKIEGTFHDDQPAPNYSATIVWTDLPDGEWTFAVYKDGVLHCILITEW